MSITIRTQVLIAALLVCLPVVGLMYLSSGATYREHMQFLADDAERVARLLADARLDDAEPSRVVAAAMAALPTTALVTFVDAGGRLVAGAPPPDPAVYQSGAAPWSRGGVVTVYLPNSVAWERTWPIYRRNYIVVLGVTLVVVAIIFGLSRRWRAGLRALEQQAHRVGKGTRSDGPPPKMPSTEMLSLQRSLLEMETNLQFLERQVVRQERLAAIGVLASGIAHELNNPLQAIAGRAQLAGRDPSLGQETRADLDLIQRESARASNIIRNLSRFSRQEAVAPSLLRLRDVVASVIELRQRRLDELGIHLVVEDVSERYVNGVLAEFQQVLLNFVVNAEQVMGSMKRGQRLLTIRTRDLGDRVYCEVEDTGPGVAVEDEPKLFQPFFTTKPVGEGTGLGLSVSHNIIESNRGRIGYRRADAGGAIFWFDLPAT